MKTPIPMITPVVIIIRPSDCFFFFPWLSPRLSASRSDSPDFQIYRSDSPDLECEEREEGEECELHTVKSVKRVRRVKSDFPDTPLPGF